MDGTGAVAAFTELRVGHRPGAMATTEDTAVVAHRRRLGLASWVKAESLRRLAEDRPDVARVTTANHETNTGMLAINRALGFVAVSRWAAAVLDL